MSDQYRGHYKPLQRGCPSLGPARFHQVERGE